ncbi:MAG: protoglobin domain-containing protein [Planctomycetota bacterium]|nr:protoglobin domain-containing protein [Planctomycetota bacterium]
MSKLMLPLFALATLAASFAFTGCAAPAAPEQLQAMSDDEFADLKKSLLFTEEDERYLRMSRAVLEPNVQELLDVWYGFVGANPHLLAYFSHPTTKVPDGDYLAKVRVRFGDWVLATADANFDRDWLNYQLEVGLRHHRLKKNTTDGADAADHIPLRHLVALHYPITTTMKPFLERGGRSPEEVSGMYEAWRKAVLLTTILWSQPYVAPEDY